MNTVHYYSPLLVLFGQTLCQLVPRKSMISIPHPIGSFPSLQCPVLAPPRPCRHHARAAAAARPAAAVHRRRDGDRGHGARHRGHLHQPRPGGDRGGVHADAGVQGRHGTRHRPNEQQLAGWGELGCPQPFPLLLSLEMATFVLKDAKCYKVVYDLKKILFAESFSNLSFKKSYSFVKCGKISYFKAVQWPSSVSAV